MKALNRAIETEGLKLLILLRLCPLVPFTIFNTMCGATSISYTDFLIGLLGVAPLTIMFVFMGTTASDITKAAEGDENWDKN